MVIIYLEFWTIFITGKSQKARWCFCVPRGKSALQYSGGASLAVDS